MASLKVKPTIPGRRGPAPGFGFSPGEMPAQRRGTGSGRALTSGGNNARGGAPRTASASPPSAPLQGRPHSKVTRLETKTHREPSPTPTPQAEIASPAQPVRVSGAHACVWLLEAGCGPQGAAGAEGTRRPSRAQFCQTVYNRLSHHLKLETANSGWQPAPKSTSILDFLLFCQEERNGSVFEPQFLSEITISGFKYLVQTSNIWFESHENRQRKC